MRQLPGGFHPTNTGNADHAFPQRSNFERGSVFNSSEQRLNATIGKDVEDELSCFVEDVLEKQRDLTSWGTDADTRFLVERREGYCS